MILSACPEELAKKSDSHGSFQSGEIINGEVWYFWHNPVCFQIMYKALFRFTHRERSSRRELQVLFLASKKLHSAFSQDCAASACLWLLTQTIWCCSARAQNSALWSPYNCSDWWLGLVNAVGALPHERRHRVLMLLYFSQTQLNTKARCG